MAQKPKTTELSPNDITNVLYEALSAVLIWMPPQDIGKAIFVSHPQDPNKMAAVLNTFDGVFILENEDLDKFISETICDDCKAKLKPFSVIITGENVVTGQLDPEAQVGLVGGHDEDVELAEIADREGEVAESNTKPTLTMRGKSLN